MDARKNKRSSNNKKASKHDSRGGKPVSDSSGSQPRILLKPKEHTDVQKKGEPTITIATKVSQARSDQQQTVKEGIKQRTPHETPQSLTIVNRMVKSVNLVSSNNTLNVHAFDYLQENNSDFFVIGAIGMQGSGKSTVLNLLAADPTEETFKQAAFHVGGGVFPVTSVFTQCETGEFEDEIRIHITKDRLILLDSAPVLSNRGKKDFVLSELDDIRRIIFLLSVCHVLVVIQEDYFNINFVRLLRCAEMMIQRDQKDMQFLNPRILFVKNNCARKNFALHEKKFYETMCRQLLGETKLKINSNQDDKEQINILYFPKLSYGNFLFTDDESSFSCIQKLRERVFMTPTDDTEEGRDILTEKSWSQIIHHVLEGHNNNYFLRKYENLKEKYNLHNHVNVVENAAKEKSYLNFVDT
ncbi:nonsense-mediated mRNA decay factor SMG9 isoform X2 [Ochlerotatus camptorhynchus]|uniref:nonsense-mediated mRNA decay factor SMG9 isoform X2 n=1 Tax=Ochlerotatus camptorhynchus TaxID=644619 RepID=UPI0031E31644